jgi:ribosomal protein L37AE/L43A
MAKTALLPGGFKPPHKGHYAIAKILSKEGEVLVRVGSGERDGITQDMSIKIWKIYGFEAEPAAKNSPIHDVFTYVEKEAKTGEEVIAGTGEKDYPRFKALEDPNHPKYPLYNPRKISFKEIKIKPQEEGISASDVRKALKNNDKKTFQEGLPDGIDKDKVWNIVTNLEEDLYNPEDKVLDYMRSSEYKAGYSKKDDVPPGYKYRRGGMYSGGGMGYGGMYETRGGESELHIYDFDETIARAETPIPYEVKSPDGNIIEKGKTTSVEFEKKKEELENDYDKGVKIDYNFDAFKKLIGNATINNPVFQKLLNSIKNPNAKVTILTARSVGLPVTQFLKEQGIWAYVVPLGLEVDGAVTGQDKADWIEKRIKDTTKKVIFIDDADENREAVSVLSQKYPNVEFDIQDPPSMDEMMMGMMSPAEKKKHAKKMKTLSKDLNKINKGDQYVEVPKSAKGSLTRKMTKQESVMKDDIVCDNCGWQWKIKDGGNDLFTCHKCYHDNTPIGENYPPYKANQVQQTRYKASDVFTRDIKKAEKMGYKENIFTKKWWKEIINEMLLTEGGAAGHMNHPFDDRELTFGEMKELARLSLQGKLNVESDVTEKTDGQNLAVTYKNGKVGAARNKSTIKEPMSIDAVAAKFEGRGDIKDAFVNSMTDLENALKELDEDTLNNVFQKGTNFLNMEIIYPATKNVITYGPQAYLQFHGLDKYDLETAKKLKSSGVPDSLKNLTQNVNTRNQDTFEIIPPKVITTKAAADFDKKEPYYINQIEKLQNEYSLSDDDPVLTYHEKWWEKNIDEKFPNVTEEEKSALVRRWASFKKDYPLRKIADETTRQAVITYDKQDFKGQNKQNVYKFEKIFLELGVDVLSNVDNYLAVNPKESVKELRKDIQNVIKQIKNSKDLDVLKKLEYQLKRIQDIGGFDKLVPSEGIVFTYKGKTYKLTGLFAPVNQLLGLTKYV